MQKLANIEIIKLCNVISIIYLSNTLPSIVYEDIRIVSGLTGKACRDQVGFVHAALLGQDPDTSNSVIFAIIIGVIGHPESPKKQFIESATQDFVICHEHDRSELLQASEQGHLLHLPLPLGAAVDLRSLPGYISLNPADNPDGFESTWLDYFVFIFNLLCFEATTSHNIGELESKLHQFQLSSDSFSSHPFHQKHGENTTQWAARISHAHREVIAACAKAQCSSRCPDDAQLVSIAYACVLPSTWTIADLIMRERNFHPQTFQEAISLMLDAERRVHHQDPKVTLAHRLRAHQPGLTTGPTAPLTPSTPPSAVPSTIPATTPTKKTPPIDAADLDKHFDIKWIRQIFAAEPPLIKRPTQVLNGNIYYSLPSAMPQLSHQLKNALDAASRCNNCANADDLFPMHSWKRCPFHTPPHRASVWPVHHSPIPSIAATPAVQKQFFPVLLDENPAQLEDIRVPEEPPPRGTIRAPSYTR